MKTLYIYVCVCAVASGFLKCPLHDFVLLAFCGYGGLSGSKRGFARTGTGIQELQALSPSAPWMPLLDALDALDPMGIVRKAIVKHQQFYLNPMA